mmetsp:Transcript_34113/g.98352  ORF Transcript_34113/g.98352 Transcript_34113/m.98352 type:complete len:529 (-) Transcript_34113:1438-3024(-)
MLRALAEVNWDAGRRQAHRSLQALGEIGGHADVALCLNGHDELHPGVVRLTLPNPNPGASRRHAEAHLRVRRPTDLAFAGSWQQEQHVGVVVDALRQSNGAAVARFPGEDIQAHIRIRRPLDRRRDQGGPHLRDRDRVRLHVGVTSEADIEDATRHVQRGDHVRALFLGPGAHLGGAVFHGLGPRRLAAERLHAVLLRKEGLRKRHGLAAASADALGVVVRQVAVEVAAMAVLPTGKGRHLDEEVEVLLPTIDRHPDAQGKLQLDTSEGDVASVLRAQGGAASLGETCGDEARHPKLGGHRLEDPFAIPGNVARHRLHDEHMVLEERAPDRDRIGRRLAPVSPARCPVPRLDACRGALDEPEVADRQHVHDVPTRGQIALEVEDLDVWIPPNHARAPVLHRRLGGPRGRGRRRPRGPQDLHLIDGDVVLPPDADLRAHARRELQRHCLPREVAEVGFGGVPIAGVIAATLDPKLGLRSQRRVVRGFSRRGRLPQGAHGTAARRHLLGRHLQRANVAAEEAVLEPQQHP